FPSMTPLHPRPTLFPYTTLFRSEREDDHREQPDGNRGTRDDHRAAGVGHRLHERGLDVLSLAQLVAEAEDHQQRIIDRHAEADRSEEHTSELQSLAYLVCRLLLE